MTRTLPRALVLALCLAVAAPAQARPRRHLWWSLGTAVLTLMAPLAIGGDLMASDSEHTRNTGLGVALAGLAVAPLASHAIDGEWGRGAALSIAPTACGLGILAVVVKDPSVVVDGRPATRVPLGLLLATALASSTLGVIDSLVAPERSGPRIAPMAGPQLGGLMVEGRF